LKPKSKRPTKRRWKRCPPSKTNCLPVNSELQRLILVKKIKIITIWRLPQLHRKSPATTQKNEKPDGKKSKQWLTHLRKPIVFKKPGSLKRSWLPSRRSWRRAEVEVQIRMLAKRLMVMRFPLSQRSTPMSKQLLLKDHKQLNLPVATTGQ